ncbi:shikimate kinase [Fodinicurvata sediminis]|uniref:shikimate kinase n=1 Tax=Fodinicurvata sediminis TaxID=1121832 RepID=UPI0003B5D6EB|nr:shikimate kinase [Fodinicurvata sediminis]
MNSGPEPRLPEILEQKGVNKIVLVGLMGAGKSCVGRRLATRYGLSFIDADSEIEAAAGCSIPEIFARDGEEAFRTGERKVIARLLRSDKPAVIATGGGAYMNAETRAEIHQHGLAVWLRAELDVLARRTSKRDNRPLLKKGNPRQVLAELIETRYPVYAEADITVESREGPIDATVDEVVASLEPVGRTKEDPLERA